MDAYGGEVKVRIEGFACFGVTLDCRCVCMCVCTYMYGGRHSEKLKAIMKNQMH